MDSLEAIDKIRKNLEELSSLKIRINSKIFRVVSFINRLIDLNENYIKTCEKKSDNKNHLLAHHMRCENDDLNEILNLLKDMYEI